MNLHTLTVDTGRGPLSCTLAEPPGSAGADGALLIHLVSTRQVGFEKMPYVQTARVFLEAGCRVLSFSLPNHGEGIDGHGEGIRGMCAAFLGGEDPFARVVEDGAAVVDHCLERGLAAPGRIALSGVSRSGYCALRLAAAEARIAAVRSRPEVANLVLDRWAEGLAGRPVFLAIGNADARVGTAECLGFARRLVECEAAAGVTASRLELRVLPADGHSLPEAQYAEAARFLLAHLTENETGGRP